VSLNSRSGSIHESFIENLNTENDPTPEGPAPETHDPYDLLGLNIKSMLDTEVYLAQTFCAISCLMLVVVIMMIVNSPSQVLGV
jgi:hypothetical protein